jgi:Zn-dependent protease with chaperone function
MTAAYGMRLVCLSLACYFLVHTVLALGVWAAAGRTIRAAERMRPRDGARLLLLARWMPAMVAGVVVAGLCVPSFVLLEPEETSEEVGVVCLAAALLAAAVWMVAAGRGVRGLVRSWGYRRACRAAAAVESGAGSVFTTEAQRAQRKHGDASRVWVVESREPVLAMVGLMRPVVVISRGLIAGMEAEQLEAALAHERSHGARRDNWKRLALLVAPEIVPGWRAFAKLERAWARVTEWAADELAAGGDERRRLALAEALVRAVRLGARGPVSPLATTLVEEPVDVEMRVRRLVEGSGGAVSPRGYWMWAGVGCALLAAVVTRPGMLDTVHELLEGLMRSAA